MARETPQHGPPRRDGAPDLGAALGALAPHAEAPLAALLDGLLDALCGGLTEGEGMQGPVARTIVAALVTAGAEGAELWADEVRGSGGWRRLAAAGTAVPDAERHVVGRHQGYPGPVAVVRSGPLALVFSGAHPGSDERERRADLADILLSLVVTCGVGAPPGEPGAPAGPLRGD